MNKNYINKLLVEILSKTRKINRKISLDTKLTDLRVDSVILIQLIIKICQDLELDISKLDERVLMQIETVGDLGRVIHKINYESFESITES
jgi:acyl carrier protein